MGSGGEHVLARGDVAASAGGAVKVHAFLDGRDTPPRCAEEFLARLDAQLQGKGEIATMSGRYWAMDRDQRLKLKPQNLLLNLPLSRPQ